MKMKGISTLLLVAWLACLSVSSDAATETRVVCYYTNWSVYRPGTAKFTPPNINPYLCTHLIYAFGGFTRENTLKPFDKYQDVEKGGYAQFTGLKSYNPNLKTMIAIGGWNEGSSRFSSLVESRENRKEFVKNVVKFLRQNKFDGLDLDWEYPAFRDGSKPKDRENYAKLVQELRDEFEKESEATGRSRLLLTMAVPAGIEYINKGYDIPKLNRYLDWMNILAYDYHSAFEPSVNHHAPLYGLEAKSEYNFDGELNIDHTIEHYLEAGAEREKLVVGIPTYGRSYTLFNPEATDIGAAADGPGAQGEATREKGYLAYYEICEMLMEKPRSKRQSDDDDDDDEEYEDEDETWTIVQPNADAMGPYAYKGNQWVGYDDIDIVKKKSQYVAQKGLGGIMFWSVDNDDFRGKCHGKPYPLIEAAKEALYKSLGITEKVAVTKKPQSSRKRPRPSKPVKSESDDEQDYDKNALRNKKRTTTTETPTTSRRRQQSTTEASVTPDWGLNTPEPPTTPDPGSDFKCKEDGFFPHPRDCKKYFWCLDSGPSNLGIVAHQFTCPSGLFFNKGTDSCDYARNVLCKKPTTTTKAPTQKSTTTSARTTTSAPRTTTTSAPRISPQLSALFTTRRPLPKITAATSSTTFRQKPTTPIPAVEEEYEDEEEEEVDEPSEPDSEEDPKVIKELVDLIKKLGGVEQLEKYLASSGKGKPATSLFEKVLSKTRTRENFAPPQQNSRGSQLAGLIRQDTESNQGFKKDRPQYTTLNRQRQSTTTEETIDEDYEPETTSENIPSTTRSGSLPQYVNIRRGRPSTSQPETSERNAIFERDFDEVSSDDKNDVREYQSIRRGRPENSNDEATTSKYKTIQRGRSTTTEALISSTDLPTYSSSNPSVSQYVTINRARTVAPEVQETTTLFSLYNSVIEADERDISPSFASENGVIKNAQITTLSNIPKEESTSSPLIGIQYSTQVTISEDPSTSTQKIALFPKRTRPTTTTTTTSKPQETTESDIKVSVQRISDSPKRTRPSTTTSSTPSRSRLSNDILSREDAGKVLGDSFNRRRRVRSTTPASQETGSEDSDSVTSESDLGNRRIARPQSRFTSRRLQQDTSSFVTETENSFSPRSQGIRQVVRTKKFEIPSEFLNNDYNNDDDSDTTTKSSRPQPIRRFRPSTTTFDGDFGSLSASDNSDTDVRVIESTTEPRSTITSRSRTRPSPNPTTRRPVTNSQENDSSVASAVTNRRRVVITRRGGKFTTARSSDEFELNTEASESSVVRARKIDVTRFSPRPFGLISDIEESANANIRDENELNADVNYEPKLIGKARLTAPRIKVVEENSPSLSTVAYDNKKEIDVTKVINSNILLGKTDDRNGILLLRRPSTKSDTTSLSPDSDITQEVENKNDIKIEKVRTTVPINLQTTTPQPSERPRKRVIVKKFRPTTAAEGSSTESTPLKDFDNEIDKTKPAEPKRIIKVLRRRPASSTTVEISSTEATTPQKSEKPDGPQRVRKIIRRKLKPVQTDDGKQRILETEKEEIAKIETEALNEAQTTTSTSIIDGTTNVPPTESEDTTEVTATAKPRIIIYKSGKKTTSIITSTEPSTTIAKSYSRRVTNSPYTTSLTPTDKDVKRPTFSANGRSRRPFTSPRSTTTDEDEDEEENEEGLVFVPEGQLFTRGPSSSSTLEEEDESEEEDEVSPGSTPSTRIVNRFSPAQRGNRPVGFNRPVSTRTTTTEQPRRFNRPLGFQNRFGTTTVSPATESTSRGYVRKFANRPIESSTLINELSQARNKLFSNPKRFTTTTPSSLSNDTTESEISATESPVEITTTIDEQTLTEQDIITTTEESETIIPDLDSTTVIPSTVVEVTSGSIIDTKPTEDLTSSSEKTTTEPHHIFAVDEADSTTLKNKLYQSTNKPDDEDNEINGTIPIKTSSHLDKLFSVSRITEISSQQEKHRVNSKNESRLIEKGKLMIEKKPTLDKIGEVSRFTLIKIVEGDIPIYLTNLSHEYPGENPPFNPIRIDEARNARALNSFTDSGKENLIASESVNAAYNHRNAYLDYTASAGYTTESTNATSKNTDKVYVVESTTIQDNETTQSTEENAETTTMIDEEEEMIETTTESRFVPAALEVEERQAKKVDIITPKIAIVESSTLTIEGLFKPPEISTGRQFPNLEKPVSGGPQPFVVYAAPQPVFKPEEEKTSNESSQEAPSGRSIANFVQIQVISPDEKTPSNEFMGVPAAVEALLEKESPKPTITVSILNGSNDTNETTTTVKPITVTLTELVTGTTKSATSTTSETTEDNETTVAATTEPMEVNITTTTTTESTESKVLQIKPVDTLSKIAQKRPKLTFPRRPPSVLRATNITRIAITPNNAAVPRNRTFSVGSGVKNTPFTTPKPEKTVSYTSGKSRFSASRTQNVPVDVKKKVDQNKFKLNSTSEAPPRVPASDPSKVTIRPLRPGLLRASTYTGRRSTTTTEAPAEN